VAAVTVGSYKCSVQGRLYEYRAFWHRTDAGIEWRATASYQSGTAYLKGVIAASTDDDAELVRAKVKAGIEEYSGSQFGSGS
jgi:hypothetical protein